MNEDGLKWEKEKLKEVFLQIYSLKSYETYINEKTISSKIKREKLLELKYQLTSLNKFFGLSNKDLEIKLDKNIFDDNVQLLKEELLKKTVSLYNSRPFVIAYELHQQLGPEYGNVCEQFNFDLHQYLKNKELKDKARSFIDAMFDSYDLDKSGVLSYDELEQLYKKLGLPAHLASELMRKADTKGDNVISKEEFAAYYEDSVLSNLRIFHLLDTDNDGALTYTQAKHSIHEIFPDIVLNDHISSAILKTMDLDKDGVIDFEEWCNFLFLFSNKNFNYMINVSKLYMATNLSASNLNSDYLEDSEDDEGYSSVLKWLKVFSCGMISGGISRTIVAPLESMRVLYQTDFIKNKPLIDGLIDVYQNMGIRRFFKGNSLSVLFFLLEQAMRFSIIEYLKTQFENVYGENNITYHHFLAVGIICSTIASTLLFPIEVLRIRFIASEETKIINKIKTIYMKGGLKAFYSGLTPWLLGVMPSGSMNVMFYNLIRRITTNVEDKKNAKLGKFALLGGMAAFITNSIVYPLNVITSKFIVLNRNIKEKKDKLNTKKVIKQMFTEKGWKGFFVGYTPAILRVTIGQAINFGIYEYLRNNWVGHANKDVIRFSRMINDTFRPYPINKVGNKYIL